MSALILISILNIPKRRVSNDNDKKKEASQRYIENETYSYEGTQDR